MFRQYAPLSLLALVLTAAGCATSHDGDSCCKPGGGGSVKITEEPGKLKIDVDGQPFTEYIYQGAPRPYFYPILGPSGAAMTRNYPMKDIPGEEHDHIHHRSLWWGHRDVNGMSFWEETGKQGTITHEKFLEVKSGEVGVIRTRNQWASKEGVPLCYDERTMRIYGGKGERMLDFEITIYANTVDLTFGDDKDGAMATRVAESMRLTKAKEKGAKKAEPGQGHIVLSTGVRDNDTWGKRADWCDYYGPVDGKTVGVAMFDHPSNPRHPTWWHVRDYGLFAANPFGQHNFEKLPDPKAGEMVVKKGDKVTFKYRFLWHDGDELQGKVAEHWQDYSKAK